MSSKGSLAIVLHAHLPFVRHPEHPHFLEEDWFFEAVAETYIPLITMLERLARDGIRPGLTISLSPTLCAMLEDELLGKRTREYLENRLELAEEEMARIGSGPQAKAAKMYQELYGQALSVMDRYSGDLITPFKQAQQAGQIELITCSATHAVLPLIAHPESIRAQVSVAEEDYHDRFNRKSRGFWLPECAYDQRVPSFLKLSGLEYFFMESHGIKYSRPGPRFGVYAPVKTPCGVNAFGRDSESARQVWSAMSGYPGDPDYREFYRDLGFDGDHEYLRPYLHSDGVRRAVGIKYHRITGRGVELSKKELYDPDKARAKAEIHALDFLKKRMKQIDEIHSSKEVRPLIVGTYDAELFGHWWFEGPIFLESIIRNLRQERIPMQIVTPSEFLENCPEPQETNPETSSWGDNGYFESWVNDSNDWIYPRVIAAAEKMTEAANRFRHQDLNHVERGALKQAARELLLAQSSDWGFLMNVGSHSDYASARVIEHCKNTQELCRQVFEKRVDEDALRKLESKNNIFPRIDFRVFASASTF